MSKIDFTGRVAIVTGAGAGLGRCYALELASGGAKVVINDLGGTMGRCRLRTVLRRTRWWRRIKALGGQAVPNYVKRSDGGGWSETLSMTAVDAFGKVDILINNAGILRDKSFTRWRKRTGTA